MSDIDKSNQLNDIIILDDEINVLSPLCGPVPKIRNEIDTSSPKFVNINRSGSKSDMDLCHSSPNGNINKLDDTKNILNSSLDNGDDINSLPDERSATKKPCMFNYENSICSGTSTFPAAPAFMQMSQDSVNYNNNI